MKMSFVVTVKNKRGGDWGLTAVEWFAFLIVLPVILRTPFPKHAGHFIDLSIVKNV